MLASLCRVNQLQGSNTLLRSNLDRVTRERDEKQRSLQSAQQSGFSAFTAAEAQKQVNVLQQQLAFKTQEVTYSVSSLFCCVSARFAIVLRLILPCVQLSTLYRRQVLQLILPGVQLSTLCRRQVGHC